MVHVFIFSYFKCCKQFEFPVTLSFLTYNLVLLSNWQKKNPQKTNILFTGSYMVPVIVGVGVGGIVLAIIIAIFYNRR